MIRLSAMALGAGAFLAVTSLPADAFMAVGGPGGGSAGGHGPAFGGRGPGFGAPGPGRPAIVGRPGWGAPGMFGPPRGGYGPDGHYRPTFGRGPNIGPYPVYGYDRWNRWNRWAGYPWAGAYTAWPGGTSGPNVTINITTPQGRPALPTAWDLPVAGYVNQGVAPPVLYEINDLSRGRSGQRGGAKIVSVGKPMPMPGVVANSIDTGRPGPKIIQLTAQ